MESWELHQLRGLDLEVKVLKSQQRIREWYDHWEGQVYVSFSGGKDSTVLLHLVREIFPDVPAVFVDTGLEYPEIRDFVKSVEGVLWLKPDKPFTQIIKERGFPIISKEQSSFIQEYRTTKSEKLRDIRWNGNKWNQGKIAKKWRYLVDAPFKISDLCCDVMKKKPFHQYHKQTGRKPFTGEMTENSMLRLNQWLRHGCNAFESKKPKSMPISFWTDEDVWEYIRSRGLEYSRIYDMGYTRTGCMFCMFGVHLEKEPNRFQRMRETHPQIYKYCMENLGLNEVLDFINVPYE